MTNFNLPLDPTVVATVSGQTGGVAGSSNVSGTLYNSVAILDPAYIEANLALSTAQTVFNFANTIGGGSAIDNVARQLAISANNFANVIFVIANTTASNTVITQSIDAGQNAQISIIQSVDLSQNNSISNLQSVNLSQNNNINTITTISQASFNQANAAYNQANIVSTLSQTAFNEANSAYIVGTSGQTIAQAAFNAANLISSSSNSSYQLLVSNTTQSTSTTTGALTVAGGVGITGNLFIGGFVTTTAFRETSINLSSTNIDLSVGNYFNKTISSATTFTLSNVPNSGISSSFILELTNGGSYSVSWWSNVRWPGGVAPTLTSSGRDILGFFTRDGGSNWNGLILGQGMA